MLEDGKVHDLILYENTSATQGRGIIFYEWKKRRKNQDPKPLPVPFGVPVRQDNGWFYPHGVSVVATVMDDVSYGIGIGAVVAYSTFKMWDVIQGAKGSYGFAF